jgi:hypothetical protein
VKEESVHSKLVNYIKENYPDIVFNTDLAGLRITIGLAKKIKELRSSNGFPDVVIYEPGSIDGIKYNALFIELKRDGVRLYKRDGSRVKNPHFDEQHDMHNKLCERGFFACFAVGLNEAIQILNTYLNN